MPVKPLPLYPTHLTRFPKVAHEVQLNKVIYANLLVYIFSSLTKTCVQRWHQARHDFNAHI